jgi:hypothetical protein
MSGNLASLDYRYHLSAPKVCVEHVPRLDAWADLATKDEDPNEIDEDHV